MVKSFASSLILRGLLAVAVGVVAVAWPSVTVLALVVVFAAYAFIAAGLQAAMAFSSRTAKPVIGHLLLGLVDVIAGVTALAWPGATALVLVLIVASWAIAGGVVEVVTGVRSDEVAGTRAMYIVGGLFSIVFGGVLFTRPDMGAISLALVFGLFNLVAGAWMLTNGIQLRSADKKVEASLPQPWKREQTHAAA
jgi:uncharacterized membrane protein HdeD (DUF308 family)